MVAFIHSWEIHAQEMHWIWWTITHFDVFVSAFCLWDWNFNGNIPTLTSYFCNPFLYSVKNIINILKITKLESVGGGVDSQQWEGRRSTVRWSTINTVDLILGEGGGSAVNSGEGWWSTVRRLTINTVDCWSWEGGRISSQQWEGWWSTVRWLTINTVDCWSCTFAIKGYHLCWWGERVNGRPPQTFRA